VNFTVFVRAVVRNELLIEKMDFSLGKIKNLKLLFKNIYFKINIFNIDIDIYSNVCIISSKSITTI